MNNPLRWHTVVYLLLPHHSYTNVSCYRVIIANSEIKPSTSNASERNSKKHDQSFFWLVIHFFYSSLRWHSAANMSQEHGIALCIFPWPARNLLSDDKLLSYLSSLQNSLRLPALIPPPVPPGALFHPCLAWIIFTTDTWPPSAWDVHAFNSARQVNLQALIKIALSEALSALYLSSFPWWHNSAGNFPLPGLKRTDPWKKMCFAQFLRWFCKK